MSRTKRILLWVMAGFYVFGGFNHLMNPGMYLALMPPDLPNPEWLNLLSGLAEIILGVYVLEPRVRVLAAWGIIALLIAVFPANVYAALSGVSVFGWVRLPLQGILIVWAWWYTRADPEDDDDGR